MELSYQEIVERLSAIKIEVRENEKADIEALTKETEDLTARKAQMDAVEEKRNALVKKLEAGEGTEVRSFKKLDGGVPMEDRTTVENKEALYRSAFIKNLQGVELSAEERAAFVHTTENSAAVIPTETASKIFSTLGEVHPIVKDVKRINANGLFRMIRHTEVVQGAAKVVGETLANDDEQNTFVEIVLAGKKISKHVKISYELKAMAMDAFENYIVGEISSQIEAELARQIVLAIKDETKGVVEENKVTAATPGTLQIADVLNALSLLKDVGRTYVYANRADIFGSIALMENTNQSLNFLTDYQNNISGNLLGNGVKQEDALAKGEILILDPTQFVLNMASPFELIRQREATTGDWVVAGHVLAEGAMENPKAGAILTVGTGV